MYDTTNNAVGSEVSASLSASPNRVHCFVGDGQQLHCFAASILEHAITEALEKAVSSTLNVVLEPYHVYSRPIKLDFTLEEFRNSLKRSFRSDYCDWEFGASTFLSHINRYVPVDQQCAVERFITTVFRRTCVVARSSTDIFRAIASGIPQTPDTAYSLSLCFVTDVFQTTGQYKQPPGTTRPPWLGGDAGRQQLYLLRGTPDFGLTIHNSSTLTYFTSEELSDEYIAS